MVEYITSKTTHLENGSTKIAIRVNGCTKEIHTFEPSSSPSYHLTEKGREMLRNIRKISTDFDF